VGCNHVHAGLNVEDDPDRSEVLFLALTRPALVWGAPVEAVVINLAVTLLGGMILSAPVWYRAPFIYWAAAFPIHMAIRGVTSWDYHGFRTLRFWLETTGIGRTTLGNLPAGRPRTSTEIASSTAFP
jgi:type IV secretion system protein VirB3